MQAPSGTLWSPSCSPGCGRASTPSVPRGRRRVLESGHKQPVGDIRPSGRLQGTRIARPVQAQPAILVDGTLRKIHLPGDLPPAHPFPSKLLDPKATDDGSRPPDMLPASFCLPQSSHNPLPDHLALVLRRRQAIYCAQNCAHEGPKRPHESPREPKFSL